MHHRYRLNFLYPSFDTIAPRSPIQTTDDTSFLMASDPAHRSWYHLLTDDTVTQPERNAAFEQEIITRATGCSGVDMNGVTEWDYWIGNEKV